MSVTRHPQTFEPIPELFGRFEEMLRSLTPAEAAMPVPGLDWTVREVGAHVLTVVRRYLAPTERAATRSRLVALNAEDVAAVSATAAEIADELQAVVATLAAVAPGIPLDTMRPFHLGVTVSVAAGWANLIGELLVHGDDIAGATGRSWSVDDHLLEGIWRDLMPAASGWLRPQARTLDERYRLHFSFGTVAVAIDGGTVRVDAPGDAGSTPVHEIEVSDAADFTLQFPYRRRCLVDPVAALLASRFIDI